ncbi:spore germination protein GerPC [Siminovitchia sp. 179-K 8D1 HS]|uniref:spore germination protein GerPC n=1 Tax=Siminovitchia sp. 179-K 8D1 HS TaxID=3142385 RepID=UPI0039A0DFB0
MYINYHIQQLYGCINQQQKEIARLKSNIQHLSAEIKRLGEKPPMTVERLEYKFDQLKVETLEGTLNIGLSPGNLDAIDEVSIPNAQSPQTQALFRDSDMYRDMIGKLNNYIDEELDQLILDTQTQSGIHLDPPFIQMIKEDVRKQISGRADHYLHYFGSQPNNEGTQEELYHKVYQTVIADINKAVHRFIADMPNQEGMNPHGT